MSALMFVALAVAVTATMAAVDFAHARYSLAMIEVRRLQDRGLPWRRELARAAAWSVAQWGAASVAFVVNVKVSMWFLPFEALGLAFGTLIGGLPSASPLTTRMPKVERVGSGGGGIFRQRVADDGLHPEG